MRALIQSGGLLLLLATASAQGLRLHPGQAVAPFSLSPGNAERLSLRIAPGQEARLRITQGTGAVTVAWTGPGGATRAPRSNRAGVQSVIAFTLVAPGEYQFIVTPAAGAKAAGVAVQLSPAQPLGVATATEARAEEALAAAEQGQAATLANFDEAIAGFERVHAVAGLRAALSWKASYLAFRANQPRAAAPVIAQAVALAPADDRVEQANAWKTAGYVAATLANYADAWQDYERALALYRQSGDRFNQEVLLDNRGKLARLVGDTGRAEADAEAALALAQDLGDDVGVSHLQEDLGDLALNRGDMRAALATLQQALDLTRTHPADTMIGFIETDLATLYSRLGAEAESTDYLRRAQAFWQAHPYPIGQLTTLSHAADQARDAGHWTEAAADYTQALALARSTGAARETVFLLLGEGRLCGLQRQFGQAAADLAAAAALAARQNEGDAEAELANAQGDLALAQDQASAAAAHYQHALRAAQAAADRMQMIQAWGGLAHAQATAGDRVLASASMAKALHAIESTRAQIPPGALRTVFFESQHSYYALAVANEMHLGHARRALALAERARAQSLREELARAAAPPAPRALEASQRQLDLATMQLLSARAHDPGAVADWQVKVARLRERLDSIAATMQPGHPKSEHPASDTLVSNLQAQLPADMVLLEYWTGAPGSSYGWVVSRHDLHSFQLPGRESLDRLVAGWLAAVRQPFASPAASAAAYANELEADRRHAASLARQLQAALLPTGAMPAGVKTLLVVGDGPVLSVPFAMLQTCCAVAREPSIAVLLDLLRHPLLHRRHRIAIIAVPDPGSGVQLPYANPEAAAIVKLAGTGNATQWTGDALSPSRLRGLDWRPFAMVHFAGHAELQPEFPELSRLLLPDGADLWFSDIAALRLPADLVTLSGCQTANGEAMAGEGLVGLSYAFFAAGARRVLGSLWDVDDAASAELMRAFYRAVWAGVAPPQALRRAQAAVAAQPRWSDPYYWAGYTLAGDWRALPQ